MVNFAGENLSIRILDVFHNAVGSVFGPWRIRREGQAIADAKAYEIQKLAEAEAYAERIRRGEESPQQLSATRRVEPYLLPFSDLHSAHGERYNVSAARAADVRLANSVREQLNLEKAVLHAESMAIERGDPIVSDSQNLDEWIRAWAKGAECVSDEQLQKLWGFILAEKISNPTDIRLSTIVKMREFSSEDCLIIENAIAKQFYQVIFNCKHSSEIANIEEVSFEDQLRLDELGITLGDYQRTFKTQLSDRFFIRMSAYGCILDVVSQESTKILEISGSLLGTVGKDLQKIIASMKSEEAALSVAQKFIEKGFLVRAYGLANAGQHHLIFESITKTEAERNLFKFG